uniref:Uncharacterized protein n=1 Tax=Haptolina ericina TaxID=156174 RepID=A0A7S3ABI3_9EUKA
MENTIGPGSNATGDGAGEWDTSFEVGVEAIIGFPGTKQLYDLPVVTEPIAEAIAAMHPDLEVSMISFEFAQSYAEVCHMTVKVVTGNTVTTESSLDQEVWKNLTSVMQDAETVQVFLSAAINCAADDAPTPCTPAIYAQSYYEESQKAGAMTTSDFYSLAEIPSAVLKTPTVLATGTPAPAAGALAGLISAVQPLTFIFDMPVSPVVMCFPKGAGAQTADAVAGAMSLGLPLLGASWFLIAAFLAYKAYKAGGCKKMCEACKENEGGEDEDDDDEEEEMPDAMDLPPADMLALAKPGDEGDDDDDGLGEDPENESGVNLAGFLNTMFTPGIDDSTDMKVNPVLMYVIEKDKRERKLREQAEQADEDGEGGGAAAADEKKEDGGDKKSSALKRLGWNLKSEAVVADVAKQLKVIESHMATDGIEVKKINFKKNTRAGMAPFSVIDAVRLRSDAEARAKGNRVGDLKSMAGSAEAARAQLRQLKLKTKVEEEKQEETEKNGEEGEEGEEGAADE